MALNSLCLPWSDGSRLQRESWTALLPVDEVTSPDTVKPSQTELHARNFQSHPDPGAGAGAAANAGGGGRRRWLVAAVPRCVRRRVASKAAIHQVKRELHVCRARATAPSYSGYGSLFFPMDWAPRHVKGSGRKRRAPRPPPTRNPKPKATLSPPPLPPRPPAPFPSLPCTAVSAVTTGPRRHRCQLGGAAVLLEFARHLAASPSPRPSRCCCRLPTQFGL